MRIRIYMITNKADGRVYIGKTKWTIKARFNQHLIGSHNAELFADIKKLGKKYFKVNLLEFCDRTESNDRERFYIAKFNATEPSKGYNRTRGGDGGDCFSLLAPEAKAKRSEQLSQRSLKMWQDEEYVAAQRLHSKGLKRSPETIERMRAALRVAQNRPEVRERKRESQIRTLMNKKMIALIGSVFY